MPAIFPTLVPVPGSPFVFTDALFPGLRFYFGYNASPAELVTGDPLGARAAFLAALSGTAQSYGFEPLASGTLAPFTATFTGTSTPIVATIALERVSGDDVVSTRDRLEVLGAASAGRYNTTPGGSKYLNVVAMTLEANPPFRPSQIPLKWSITPNRAVAAFGFYNTDISDFQANCLIDIRRPAGAVLEMMLPIAQNSSSGNLSFWGVIDVSGGTFDKFTFGGTYVGTPDSADNFGFDDFVLADAGQVVVPAPAPAPAPSVAGTARPFISRDVKNAPGIQLQPLGNAPPPRRQR